MSTPDDKTKTADVAPAAASAAPVEAAETCADCGSDKVVACTDGVSAEKRCYCSVHRPVNLPVNVVQ